jgi:hypothetical protein
MSNYAETLGPLGFEPAESFAERWRELDPRFPADAPALLSHNATARAAEAIQISPENRPALLSTLDAILREPRLVRLWWHCYMELSQSPWQYPQHVQEWPEIPQSLGPDLRLFYAVVLLSCFDSIRRFHAERKVEDSVSLDTLSDLNVWLTEHVRNSWDFSGLRGWLINHFSGRLYKLGRLQFESHEFGNQLFAYRNIKDRRLVLLVDGGLKVRCDGQLDGANGIQDPNAFTSELSEDNDTVRGHPVSPRGSVQRQAIVLEKSLWQKVFGPGDPVLGIHIAAIGPMDHAQCGESMSRALEFFPRCFPERKFKAFVCGSWLLDSQFEDWLPRDSNIVRFLSEFYLYPLPWANDHQTMERVFRGPVKDLDSAPQKSSLQRAIIAHMKAGGHWRGQGGVIFPEDLAWGKQIYRKNS